MSKFSDYVTSTAFSLSLSRRQIEALCAIDHYGYTWCSFMTFASLETKGLVERKFPQKIDNEFSSEVRKAPDCAYYSQAEISLTEAGKAVIPLLKLAGLYIQYPERESGKEIDPVKVKLRPEYIK